MSIVRKAVIPAGGWGTRFLPATKAQPKEMLTVVDKPAIQYAIEEAVASGINEIIIITRSQRKHISLMERHFTPTQDLEKILEFRGETQLLEKLKNIDNLAKLHFIHEDYPQGIGSAVHKAKELVGDEPFAVLLSDDIIAAPVPCLKQMLDLYPQLEHSSLIAVQPVPKEEVFRYGVIAPATEERPLCLIKDLIEKPNPLQAPSNLAVVGRYILNPSIFPILAETGTGVNNEIQLTDALRILAQQESVYGYQFFGVRFDVGEKLGFVIANLVFALQRPELSPAIKLFLEELLQNADFYENSAKTEYLASVWDNLNST